RKRYILSLCKASMIKRMEQTDPNISLGQLVKKEHMSWGGRAITSAQSTLTGHFLDKQSRFDQFGFHLTLPDHLQTDREPFISLALLLCVCMKIRKLLYRGFLVHGMEKAIW
ncbi:hypothetical protein CLAIMM_13152, partial [Cladophialophora immunda]